MATIAGKDVVLQICMDGGTPQVRCRDPADCSGDEPEVWKGKNVCWESVDHSIARWFLLFPDSPWPGKGQGLVTHEDPVRKVTGKKNQDYYYCVIVQLTDGCWAFADPRIMVRDAFTEGRLQPVVHAVEESAGQLAVAAQAIQEVSAAHTRLAEEIRRLQGTEGEP
jgi:hypothetical protein